LYFDSHAHYDDKIFDSDRDVLLKNISHEVSYIINCGTDLNSSRESINLSNKYKFIYASVGLHPEYTNQLDKKLLNQTLEHLENLAQNKKVKAIGEIGLDLHYKNFDLQNQIFWFEQQINLANKLNLPVIIHSRDASHKTFELINSKSKTRGVVHCYSGDLNLALKYINLKFLIGIGGMITFRKSYDLINIINNIKLENILLETDCPYLSPEPNRGKRNDSSNLKFIAQKISQLKNKPLEEVINITSRSAINLFRI